jgi:hypothetical protein
MPRPLEERKVRLLLGHDFKIPPRIVAKIESPQARLSKINREKETVLESVSETLSVSTRVRLNPAVLVRESERASFSARLLEKYATLDKRSLKTSLSIILLDRATIVLIVSEKTSVSRSVAERPPETT